MTDPGITQPTHDQMQALTDAAQHELTSGDVVATQED